MTAPAPRPAQPEAAPKLSAKEKRAVREEARRKVVAAEQARIEAARAAERGDTPGGTPDPKPEAPAIPERSDEDRVRDAAVMLSGVLFPLLSVLAWPFGYRLDLDAFTEAQALEDARAWVPLLRRYRWLDLACTWVGAPARVVRRVRVLAKPRERKPEPPKPAKGAEGHA